MSAVAVAKVVPEPLVCVCLAPKVKTNNKVERGCRAGKLNPAWRQTRPSVTRVNFWFDLWCQPVWSLLGKQLNKSLKKSSWYFPRDSASKSMPIYLCTPPRSKNSKHKIIPCRVFLFSWSSTEKWSWHSTKVNGISTAVWWNILQLLPRDEGRGDSIATGKIYYAVTKDTGLCVYYDCNNVKSVCGGFRIS